MIASCSQGRCRCSLALVGRDSSTTLHAAGRPFVFRGPCVSIIRRRREFCPRAGARLCAATSPRRLTIGARSSPRSVPGASISAREGVDSRGRPEHVGAGEAKTAASATKPAGASLCHWPSSQSSGREQAGEHLSRAARFAHSSSHRPQRVCRNLRHGADSLSTSTFSGCGQEGLRRRTETYEAFAQHRTSSSTPAWTVARARC
jgi:hypothetical protein